MEMAVYISILLMGSIVLCVKSKFLLKYMYLPLVVVFLIIVRVSGFDVDISVYADRMYYDLSSISAHNYREFIFWYAPQILLSILGSPLLVFITMDIIWILIMWRISLNLEGKYANSHIRNGLIAITITSFPFFFGYENIYRQFYASIFALWAYSTIDNNFKKSIFIFSCSVFMHNVVLILVPLFIVKKLFKVRFKNRVLVAFILSILFAFSFDYMSNFKAQKTTGIDTKLLYLTIFYFLFFLFLFKSNLKLSLLIQKIPSIFFIVIMMSSLVLIEFDMVSERIGMMFLIFLMYDLYSYSYVIKSYKLQNIFRVSLLWIFSLPVLIFNSSRSFF